MLTHLKKNDEVQVLAGKDKGKRGKILEVSPERNRVRVENVNMVKRHQKPGVGSRQGGIIEKAALMHWSNVMLVCPKCKAPRRTKAGQTKDGKKVRCCVKCDGEF